VVRTHIYGNVAQLGPAERMVEVVFAEVVFGEVRDVGLLDVRYVRGAEDSDIHVGVSQCLDGSLHGICRAQVHVISCM